MPVINLVDFLFDEEDDDEVDDVESFESSSPDGPSAWIAPGAPVLPIVPVLDLDVFLEGVGKTVHLLPDLDLEFPVPAFWPMTDSETVNVVWDTELTSNFRSQSHVLRGFQAMTSFTIDETLLDVLVLAHVSLWSGDVTSSSLSSGMITVDTTSFRSRLHPSRTWKIFFRLVYTLLN